MAEAAMSIGCSTRLILFSLAAALLWWDGQHIMKWGSRSLSALFTGLTGFHNPLIWLVEEFANVLIILFVFYFLSVFMPGEAGQKFRELISKLSLEGLKFICQLSSKVIWKILTLTGQFLVGPPAEEKKSKK